MAAGRQLSGRIPAGVVCALEFALLGPAAAILVLVAVPRRLGIESACTGPLGPVATDGDVYVGVFAVLGTAGWLAVFAGVLLAGIAERPRFAMLLPALWFVALVGAALVSALLIGATPCPT